MKKIVVTPKIFSIREWEGKVIVEFEGKTFEFEDYNDAGEFIEHQRYSQKGGKENGTVL